MSEEKNYFKYLKTRSSLANLYRKYYLYPIISKHLKGKLLDVGCGIGDFLKFRNNTIGIDIDENMVNFCKSEGLEVVLFDNGKIPFSDNLFDGVIIDNVLEHIEDPTSLLLEVTRVIKNNGLIVIGVPGIKGYASDSDHKIFYNDEILKNLFNKFNFQEKASFYAPLFKSKIFSSIFRQYCIYKTVEVRK
jgi:ubiquinone/menaquinone biosynthesis C-methylase UbiE